MRLLFRLLDLDKSGKLSSDTIKKVFNQLGFQSSAAIDEAFAEIANPDGRIDCTLEVNVVLFVCFSRVASAL